MYDERVLRESYIRDIYKKVSSESLPPSLGRVNFQNPGDMVFRGEPCYSLLSNLTSVFPYMQHPYWPSGGTGGGTGYSDAQAERV